MTNHKLVLNEHLNAYGFLFGGYLLQWVDEYAYIAATQDYPGCRFVTIALNKVVFRKNIRLGSILKFDINLAKKGNTSVTYNVKVFHDSAQPDRKQELAFETNITFVNVDDEGEKQAIEIIT